MPWCFFYLTLSFSIPLKGEKIMKGSVNNCLLRHINTAAYTYACDIISNAPTFNTSNKRNVVTCTFLDRANIYRIVKNFGELPQFAKFFPQYSGPMKHVLWPSRERMTRETRHL